jgi:hypothetical protein
MNNKAGSTTGLKLVAHKYREDVRIILGSWSELSEFSKFNLRNVQLKYVNNGEKLQTTHTAKSNRIKKNEKNPKCVNLRGAVLIIFVNRLMRVFDTRTR